MSHHTRSEPGVEVAGPSSRGRVPRGWLLLAAVAFAVTACGSSTTDESTDSDASVPGTVAEESTTTLASTTIAPTTLASTTTVALPATPPFEVVTSTETFVDTSRPTAANGDAAELPERTLDTLIARPESPGPFPLVVLSHGFFSHPRHLTRLANAWASAGYVVAMPVHPLSNEDVPAPAFGDVVNQPADISFVIDKLLELNGDATSDLFEQIDADRIGMAGLSMGAVTSYATIYNDCCRDERIKAAVLMASFVVVAPETNDFSRSMPILLLHGELDQVASIDDAREVYAQLAGAKWFVTLLGADHSEAFEPVPADAVSKWDTVVDSSTTDFWNGTLGADPAQLDQLAVDAVSEGISTLESSP